MRSPIGLFRKTLFAGRRSHPGAVPGTVTVDPAAQRPSIYAISFDETNLVEQSVADPAELRALLERWPVTWINVDGLGDVDVLRRLAELLALHPLALEDTVTTQHAKVDEYDDNVFFVVRMLQTREHLDNEQINLFLGDRYVLTIQERSGDCLEPVRDRLRKGRGRIRRQPPDYLAYAVIDAIIDHYFPVLEAYAERLDELEARILGTRERRVVAELHGIKHELLVCRRAMAPLQHAINHVLKEPPERITEGTLVYLRDCFDHVTQAIELAETYRELAAGLVDLHIAMASYRMNDIMRVLTMFTALFIPLSFVAGLYGMNFDTSSSPWNMPELGWRFGYIFALGLMASSAIGALVYFWRKGWLRSPD